MLLPGTCLWTRLPCADASPLLLPGLGPSRWWGLLRTLSGVEPPVSVIVPLGYAVSKPPPAHRSAPWCTVCTTTRHVRARARVWGARGEGGQVLMATLSRRAAAQGGHIGRLHVDACFLLGPGKAGGSAPVCARRVHVWVVIHHQARAHISKWIGLLHARLASAQLALTVSAATLGTLTLTYSGRGDRLPGLQPWLQPDLRDLPRQTQPTSETDVRRFRSRQAKALALEANWSTGQCVLLFIVESPGGRQLPTTTAGLAARKDCPTTNCLAVHPPSPSTSRLPPPLGLGVREPGVRTWRS